MRLVVAVAAAVLALEVAFAGGICAVVVLLLLVVVDCCPALDVDDADAMVSEGMGAAAADFAVEEDDGSDS